MVKLLFFVSVALHQFVHGLACIHYRRRVREFGFTFLHGFVPTFYIDVTDIFMASRRARVVTAGDGCAGAPGARRGRVHRGRPGLRPGASRRRSRRRRASFSGRPWSSRCTRSASSKWTAITSSSTCSACPRSSTTRSRYAKSLLTGAGRILGEGREEPLWIAYVVLSTISVAAFIAFNAWIIFSATH
jgi:hypothetical protein